MRSSRIRVLAACALAATVGTTVGPGVAGAVGEKFQDVLIRNSTDAEAVPTRAVGTTKVENVDNTTLKVEGTANVSGSTVAVTAADGAPLPVQVTNQVGATPTTTFQKRFFVDQLTDVHPALEGLINSEQLFKVAPDERLTITHISGGGGGMHDAIAYLRLIDWCQGDDTSPKSTFPVAVSPNAEGAWPTVNQSLTYEIGPGRCLHLEVRRQESPGEGITYPLTVVGYVTKVG